MKDVGNSQRRKDGSDETAEVKMVPASRGLHTTVALGLR